MEDKCIETRLFINGEFVPSLANKTFALTNPATDELTANVYEADVEDVDLAVQSAADALPVWSRIDASERQKCINKLADLVDQYTAEFARLEAISMGKPVATYLDASYAVSTLRYYAGKSYDVQGVTSLNSNNYLNLSLRQPYGVVGAIIPWNVPLIMLSMKVAPALIAGNCLVIKSSEKAPLTSLLFARLSKEANIPPGVLNILSGFGNPCGNAIASHMQIRKIAFTGSVPTGKLVQKAAADSNLKACTLELGGKSPLVVFEDANLEKAASAAAFSIVFNSGQICMASSRVYVHQTIASKFIELYKKSILQVTGKVGDPLDPKTTYGPVADRQQYNSLKALLEAANDDQHQFLIGGPPKKEQIGCYIYPTIVYQPPEDSDIMKKEIFGAVSCVSVFRDEEEVIKRANDTQYGLYASVFTRDINRAIRIARAFESGSVAVNTTSPYYCVDLPLGGFKSSGNGREMGQEGLDAWTEVKSVYIDLS